MLKVAELTMESFLVYILVFYTTARQCYGNECSTGCAPMWNLPAPSLSSVDRLQNEDVDFQCQAFGNPAPMIRWSRDQKSISHSTDGKVILGSDSLRVLNLYPPDSGLYTCFVKNRFGSLSWSFYLTVYEKDSDEIEGPKNTSGYINETLNFWCNIGVAGSKASVTWLHDVTNVTSTTQTASVVKSGDYHEYDQLVIPRVSMADNGMYTCVVNTSLTSVRRSAWMDVFEKDIPMGSVQDGTVAGHSTELGRYLETVGIVVGSLAGLILASCLIISGGTLYWNRRRLKAENRGTKRLEEEAEIERRL